MLKGMWTGIRLSSGYYCLHFSQGGDIALQNKHPVDHQPRRLCNAGLAHAIPIPDDFQIGHRSQLSEGFLNQDSQPAGASAA